MLFIARGIQKRAALFCQRRTQPSDRLGVGIQLAAIALLKGRPAGGLVTKPLTELGARRDLLEPQGQVRLLLGNPARPDPIHEDTRAVTRRRRFINPLDGDLEHGSFGGTTFIASWVAPSLRPDCCRS